MYLRRDNLENANHDYYLKVDANRKLPHSNSISLRGKKKEYKYAMRQYHSTLRLQKPSEIMKAGIQGKGRPELMSYQILEKTYFWNFKGQLVNIVVFENIISH